MVGVCFMWPDESGCVLELSRKTPLTAPFPLILSGVVLPLLSASLLLLRFLNVGYTNIRKFWQKSIHIDLSEIGHWSKKNQHSVQDRDLPFGGACSEGRRNKVFFSGTGLLDLICPLLSCCFPSKTLS